MRSTWMSTTARRSFWADRHGIEVTTEAEAGLLRAADEEHVADALKSQGYLGGVQPRRDGEPGPLHLSLGTTRGRAALTARR